MQDREGACAADLGITVRKLSCYHYSRIFVGDTRGCATTATCPYYGLTRRSCFK